MKIRTKFGVTVRLSPPLAMAGFASAATFIDTWTVNSTTGAISVVIGDSVILASPGAAPIRSKAVRPRHL